MAAPAASLLVLLTLAGVLCLSGVSKLREPRALQDAMVALRVPAIVPQRATARVVPWVEVGLGVLLVGSPAPLLLPVATVTAALMLTYAVLVRRALGFDQPVECACFGGLGSQTVDRLTVARNVALFALAVIITILAADGSSAPAAAASLDADGWWAVAAALAAVLVTTLVLGVTGAAEAHTNPEPAELDYERQPIPYGVLRLADGSTATLAELASTQARLLVVLNSHCGPCARTAEKIDAWADALAPEVDVLVLYADRPAATAHASARGAVEPDLNVRRVFSVGAPGAVLLGADGLMAGGPVAGEGDVERFVGDVLAELERLAPPTDS